jgi:nicotinate phosphoribosyltransferase
MKQPIVRSLLETDLYKFTMWQALLHGHPNSHTEYEFVCRNTPAFPLADLREEVERELDHLCSMSFRDDELSYLRSLRYMKSDFVDFLTVFRFQRKFIDVGVDGDTLTIRAAGPQVHVMGFEIYVLYIVNELYFRRFDAAAALAEGRARLAPRSPR